MAVQKSVQATFSGKFAKPGEFSGIFLGARNAIPVLNFSGIWQGPWKIPDTMGNLQEISLEK